MRLQLSLALLFVVFALGPVAGDGPTTTDTVNVTVVRAINGDTLECRWADGGTNIVQLVGVDAPEWPRDSQENLECFRQLGWSSGLIRALAKNATDGISALVGCGVTLEGDQRPRDAYNRIPVYIWYNEKLVNEVMASLGLGLVRFYTPRSLYPQRMWAAQETAKRNRAGLWKYVTTSFVDPVPTPTYAAAASPTWSEATVEVVYTDGVALIEALGEAGQKLTFECPKSLFAQCPIEKGTRLKIRYAKARERMVIQSAERVGPGENVPTSPWQQILNGGSSTPPPAPVP